MEIEKRLKERAIQQQESLVTEGTTLEANLSTNGISLDVSLVTEGIALDASLVAKQSTVDSTTSSKQHNESNGSRNKCSKSGNENIRYENESSSSRDNATYAEKTLVDTVAFDIEYADIEPSYDNDTVSEVHHDTFENVFAHGIQNYEQPKSIPDTYVVNENNSNIIFDIPNMDPDRGKEEHDYVDYEKQRALYVSLINNLKCDVEKCNKINLLNDEISNHKSQACEKDKTFAKENDKYDEYVQPLLKRKNELEKKSQEFLKQINDLEFLKRKIKDENRSFDKESSSSEGNNDDADIGPSNDCDTMTKVPYSNNDTFENVLAHAIQSHELPESIPDTYEVNENNSNIIYDIPNMDPDRD
ncbi:hypothetical protein Tco_1141615 [Tanacetum coccineum]